MGLVHNEQIKLSATFLNGVAQAVFAVGCLGPVVAMLIGSVAPGLIPLGVAAGCWMLAVALHLVARRILRRLLP